MEKYVLILAVFLCISFINADQAENKKYRPRPPLAYILRYYGYGSHPIMQWLKNRQNNYNNQGTYANNQNYNSYGDNYASENSYAPKDSYAPDNSYASDKSYASDNTYTQDNSYDTNNNYNADADPYSATNYAEDEDTTYEADSYNVPTKQYQDTYEDEEEEYTGKKCYQCSYDERDDKMKQSKAGSYYKNIYGGWNKCRGPFSYAQAQNYGIDDWKCESNCYIRRNKNGQVYRGCYQGAYGVNPDKLGCHYQQGALWCFCAGDRCNYNSPPALRIKSKRTYAEDDKKSTYAYTDSDDSYAPAANAYDSYDEENYD
ncbi:unnamed protein product [Owenia fusiformis]|uniref:Uncharacterized protein n=1 Tax=Owenia fusiformis TaxID=6347 RepID=A0A8J1UGA9_OWEFU|nr:unnamed protein product [Owenia fusiformis]